MESAWSQSRRLAFLLQQYIGGNGGSSFPFREPETGGVNQPAIWTLMEATLDSDSPSSAVLWSQWSYALLNV